MTPIPAYKVKPAVVKGHAHKGFGGYNSRTKTLTPMKIRDGSPWQPNEVFDNVTLATEAGLLTEENWPDELFDDLGSFKAFLDILEPFNETDAIHDRWWQAFRRLGNKHTDTHYFGTSTDIAQRLDVIASVLRAEAARQMA